MSSGTIHGRAYGTGKRKTAIARVFLKPGTGQFTVNGRGLSEYFPRPTAAMIIQHAFEVVDKKDQYDVMVTVRGGGLSGQAEAVRHGVCRALIRYVIDAEKSGFIYRGVHKGVDAATLKRAIQEQQVESALQRVDVRKGQCFFLPSGTIHALGAGVTVAEIQTPSDITYRLYDWNRVDPSTGSTRELHLEQALECVSYDPSPIPGEHPEHVASISTAVTRLVRCDSFVIERVRLAEGVERDLAHFEFVIWMVLEGRGAVSCDGYADPFEFRAGDTVLLPAALKSGRVRTAEDCMWLEVTVPIPSSLRDFERPNRESLKEPTDPRNGVVQLHVPDKPRPP